MPEHLFPNNGAYPHASKSFGATKPATAPPTWQGDTPEQIAMCMGCIRSECRNCIELNVYNRSKEKMWDKYNEAEVVAAVEESRTLSEAAQKLGIAKYLARLYIRKAAGGAALKLLLAEEKEVESHED